VNILYQIFVRYGSDPFGAASAHSSEHLLYYFLHRRLTKSTHPERYRSRAHFEQLVSRFLCVPRATRRRHGWILLSVSGRWDCITHYGCRNAACPEKTELLKLRDKRIRGRRDPHVEERLFKWGAQSKICARLAAVIWKLRRVSLPCCTFLGVEMFHIAVLPVRYSLNTPVHNFQRH
jgi:hypothetical protein